MITRQMLAALLAGQQQPQQQMPPGPMFTQPPLRDPVATMNGVMGGAGGVGGGGSGLLGGLDPMKLAQLQQMFQAPRGTSVPGGAGMAQPGTANFSGTGGLY